MRKTRLEHIDSPDDLKHLSTDELTQLASEIREMLLQIGDKCGGHLASNLGVVELTLAIHSVFDSPKDKILWDTSHQCYVHKILTGRRDRMFTIRQDGGLSGFAKITESEHDIFGAGHASTSLSAALGVAHARDLREEDYSVIAVAGDASLSGGMAYEALNNAARLKSNFICILNDNDMSISRPVGAMATYITNLRTSATYTLMKQKFESIIERIPKIGVPLKRKIERTVDRIKDMVIDVPMGVIFEEFGFKYLGPLDGHNLPLTMAALKYAKSYPGPIMIHLTTVKGKGHVPAENDPITYHGVSPKKPTANIKDVPIEKPKTYTETFGQKIIELARAHPDLVVVTPAMKGGSGLNQFAETFPDRFFDVGIAEEHAVTFCAGLAKAGVKPVLSIYSTFLQRGFDQVIHDVCLQKLPVIFTLDRAGLVGEDGPTHHGVLDYAYLLPIPNLTILAPKDGIELEEMMAWAAGQQSAISIRFPKGPVPNRPIACNRFNPTELDVLFDNRHTDDETLDACIIGTGAMAWPAYDAALTLEKTGLKIAVINPRCLKPLDSRQLKPYLEKAQLCTVVEEGTEIGGFASYLRQVCEQNKIKVSAWQSIALPDHFIDHGKLSTLLKKYHLDSDGIAGNVQLALNQHPTKAEVTVS